MSKGLFEEELKGRKSRGKKQYAILRLSKIKTFGGLGGSSKHVTRERETLNADQEKLQDNEVLIGSGDPEQDVRERLAEAGIQKIRKNGVIAVDFVLTASPEYFRPESPGKAGHWEPERLEAWKKHAVEFLKNEYGQNMVSAVLHLDEATPHIHAYMVPINQKGRLSARDYFGHRKQLVAIQDKFAESMKELGLERGERGSKAKHTSIQKYYARAQAEPGQKPEYDQSLYEGIKPKSIGGLVKASEANRFAEDVAKRVLEKERESSNTLAAKYQEAEAKLVKQASELKQLRPQAANSERFKSISSKLLKVVSKLPPEALQELKQVLNEPKEQTQSKSKEEYER